MSDIDEPLPPAYTSARPEAPFPTDEEVDRFGREILQALALLGIGPGDRFRLTVELESNRRYFGLPT